MKKYDTLERLHINECMASEWTQYLAANVRKAEKKIIFMMKIP